MDQLLEKNLITTKDAGELSGYTSDYLARLARSGKIVGKRIGHSWLIDKESLARFIEQQGDRKVDQARALARAREEEYRAHHSLLNRAAKTLTTPLPVPKLGITGNAFRSQALALSVALLAIVSGALATKAAVVPRLAVGALAVADEIMSGFDATFGDIPSRVISRIESVKISALENQPRVAAQMALTSARFASSILARPDFSSLQMALVEESSADGYALADFQSSAPLRASNEGRQKFSEQLSLEDLAPNAYAFVTEPSRIIDSIMHVHAAVGEHAYAAITDSFDAYHSLIGHSGARALAIAASARDLAAQAPGAISTMNLALGNSIISSTHALVRAEVAAVYGLAAVAPESARATVALLGGIGDALSGATARVPTLATTAFLRATAAPARLGPGIAQAVFDAEYAGAVRFVAAARAATDGYLAFVEGAGTLAYDGVSGARSLARSASSLAARAPAAFEDAYLGALGKGALAIETVARVPKVAAVLSAVRTTSAPVLAAVAPTLSVVERIALATYETIRGFLDSTQRSLASLFAPPPTIVLPTGVPKPRIITVGASPAPTSSNSYPTYTTVVRGVSEDFVNQSLSSLRSQVLATVAGMIQPVAAQTVTNATTIQHVNMIQDLSNLIVRNGDFRGGVFDNGTRVSATSGTFTNLTGGTTNLGATTITGSLAITGAASFQSSISAASSISAPYFVATSSTATSTFAGSVAIDTDGFVYATSTRNVGIGVLSPAALLAIKNSTSTQPIFVASSAAGSEVYRLTNAGFIGIGTSSPDAMIALQQSSNGTTFISAYRATDTAPSGDFINYKTKAGGTLFRVDNSGNLLAGGIINTGSQTITSTSTPQFRVQYDSSNEWTSTVTSFGSTTIAVNGTTPSLAFTPQSNALNTFNFTNAASASILSIDTLNRRIGIGTTTPASTLDIYGTDALHLPMGTTGQRPSMALAGQVRYNTTTHQFEGYGDNSVWQGLGGVIDADQDTYITADTSNADEDTLRFFTFGSQRLTIGSTGNVGIGTTSPFASLQIATTTGKNLVLSDSGAGTDLKHWLFSSKGGNFYLGTTTDAYATSSASRFSILSNGRFGFGTSSPAVALDIFGSDALRVPVGTTGQRPGTGDVGFVRYNTTTHQFEGYGDNAVWQGLGGVIDADQDTYITADTSNADEDTLRFFTFGSERLTIGSTGNLGIGTTSPFASLQIATTTGKSLVLSDAGAGANLKHWLFSSLGGNFYLGTTTDAYATSSASRFSILSSGRFGFGTSSPAVALDIYGSDALRVPVGTTGQRPGTGDVGFVRYNTTTHQFEGYGDNAVWQGLGGVIDADQDTYITADTSNADEDTLRFFTFGSQRLTITNAGNIGVASTSPFAKFAIHANNGETNTALFTIASSTASATSTLFSISNTGNVGIGTTSPASLLSVHGNGYFSGTAFFGGAITATSTLNVTGLATFGNASTTQIGSTGAAYFATSGGSVGIGTTTPGSLLHLSKATAADADLRFESQTYNWVMGIDNSDRGKFKISSSTALGTNDRFVIDGSGNLGLGTSSPSVALDIASNKTGINIWAATGANFKKASIGYSSAVASDVFTISTDANAGGTYQDIQIVPHNNSGYTGLYMNTSGQAGLGYTSFDTSMGTAFMVNGRVGIGTSTPGGPLSVTTNGRASGDLRYGLAIVNSDNATTQATNIGFFGKGGSGGNKWVIGTDVNHDNSNNFFIATSSGAGVTAPFIINSDSTIQFANLAAAPTNTSLRLYEVNGALWFDSTQLTGGTAANYWSRSGSSVYSTTLSDKYGVGSTSPFAKFVIHAPATDTNTTLFAIASSTASATTTLFSISNTGNLTVSGTATSTFAGNLSVTGNINLNGFLLQDDAPFVGSQWTTSGSNIYYATGNVGIGTTSPWANLSIAGSSTYTGNPLFAVSSSTPTATTTAFLISSQGNVGIGTASPVGLLHVGTAADSQIFVGVSSDPGWTIPAIQIGSNASIWQQAADYPLRMAYNAFYGGSEKRIRADAAADIVLDPAAIRLRTAASDSAGSAITWSERLTVLNNGDVGIGAASPANRLEVRSSTVSGGGASNGNVGMFYFTNDTQNESVLGVMSDATAASSWRLGQFYSDLNGTPDAEFVFRGDGTPLSDNAATTPADFAEWLRVVGSPSGYEPGDLVMYAVSVNRKVEKATRDSEEYLAGVVTLKPGMVGVSYDIGTDVTDAVGDKDYLELEVLYNAKMVAMIGLTPVKVTTENGPFQSGDPITVSSIPGIGMKAEPGDKIIGYAMEAFDPANGEMGTHDVDLPTPIQDQPFHPLTTSITLPNGQPGYRGWIFAHVDLGYARIGSILAGTATSTITNIAYLNATTTTTNQLCLSGDCRTSWPSVPSLSGYALLADVPSVSSFVSTTTLTSTLSGYATTASLVSYATAANLASATSSLASLDTRVTTLENAGYLTASSLAPFVSTTTLASTLAGYASLSDIPSIAHLISTSTLASTLIPYVQFSDLSSTTAGTLSGTLTGNILPNVSNAYAIGSMTNKLSHIYAQNVIAGDLGFSETTSAVSGSTLVGGDVLALYVSATGGACTGGQSGTCTIPISFSTAINTASYGASNIHFNTTGSFAIGVASTTAPRGKLDVEGSIASGDARFLTLANTSGANGNAALAYSMYIPSTTGDLNFASNDNNGALINTSYSAWNLKLGGQTDTFSISRSPTATLAYSNLFNIASSGNVGIGTTSPWANLSIAGSSAYTGRPLFAVSSSTPTATTTAFLINSQGNVGIGTTNPTSKLYVQSTDASQTQLVFKQAVGQTGDAMQVVDSSGTQILAISKDGYLGLGGITPTEVLHSNVASAKMLFGNSTASNKFVFNNSGSVYMAVSSYSTGSFSKIGIGGTSNPGTILTDVLTVATDGTTGLVGIGTTSPASRFSVHGNGYFSGTGFFGGALTATSTLNVTGLATFGNASTTQIGSTGAAYLATSGADVGIGTTTPSSYSGSAALTVHAANPGIILYSTSGSRAWEIENNGSFLIYDRTAGGGARLTISSGGDVNFGGGTISNYTAAGADTNTTQCRNSAGNLAGCTSLLKWKENITDLSDGLNTILQLRPVSFDWKSAAASSSPLYRRDLGFIAEEVEAINPLLALHSEQGMLEGVRYSQLTALMAKGIQELNTKVEARTAFIANAATSTVLTVDVAGNVGIGTTTPNHTLTVAGDVAAIAFVNTSTRSAKMDISYDTASSSEERLNQLVDLKVATYRYTIEDQQDPLRLGFIAEDAQTIAPEILSPDGKGVDIYKLATFTLSGVQALAAKVDAQNTHLTALEERVTALENGSISTASGSPITLSTTSLASAFNSFGVLIEKGIAQFNTLVFRQLVASKDADGTSSAGSVLMLAGNTVAQVNNSLVKPSTKVFVTFNSQITGSWWVSDKTAGSFRVILSAAQPGDVSFDYFLVQTEGQLATSSPSDNLGVGSPSGTDTTPPVITLLGDNPLRLSIGGTFVEPGITVADAADPAASYTTYVNGVEQEASAATINTSSQMTYIITYKATDATGNMSTAMRSVIVGSDAPSSGSTASSTPASTDTTAPVVTLVGDAAMQITVGNTFTDPGATATDDTDGSLTSSIVVTGAVDAATAGLYTLTYTATDAAGNSGTASRVVTVAAPAS